MTQLSPNARKVARRVLEHETKGRQDAEDLGRAINRACVEIHQELVNLIGPSGVHILIGRALYLAKKDFPCLEGVAPVAGQSGCLHRVSESLQGRHPMEAKASVVAVLAHLIQLLTSLLGEELGLHPIRRIWPEVVSGNMTPQTQETRQ
jgi:hypothetical protein